MPPSPRERQARVLATLLLVGVIVGAYYPVLGFGLLGHDTFPIVSSTTVRSAGDLWNLFAGELMQGRFWSQFYRPVLSVSLAADHALWGLEGFGYQLTSLLLFVGCALALFVLVARLSGGLRPALLAGLIFALYPSHYEVLPVAARRADLLAALFAMLALGALLTPTARTARRPLLWPGVLALLAMGSKETALVLPGLAFLLVLLVSPSPTWRSRLTHAAQATLSFALAAAIAFGVRLVVLGAVGGHGTAGVDALARVDDLGMRLLFPQPGMATNALAQGLAVTAAITVAAGALLLGRRRALPDAEGPETCPRSGRAAIFGLAWTAGMLLLHAYTGKSHAWYVFFPSVGWAMLCGATIDALAVAANRRGLERPGAWTGALGAALLTLLVAWQSSYAPLFRHYAEWPCADAALTVYLENSSEEIRKHEGGGTLQLAPVPSYCRRADEAGPAPRIASASILRPGSVQAWAELAFPTRTIVVSSPQHPLLTTPDPETLVLLIPRERIEWIER